MTGFQSFLKALGRQTTALTIACLSGGLIGGLAQTDTTKDIDGWLKAKWGMTDKELLQALKDEGARPAERSYGLSCDPAVTVPVYQFVNASRVARAKFSVEFYVDQFTRRLCEITIRPYRSVRFDDVRSMLVQMYGPPSSEADEFNRTVYWRFPSTTVGVSLDGVIAFYPVSAETPKNLVTLLVHEPETVAARQPVDPLTNAMTTSGPTTTLTGKVFLLTRGGDLMLARFARLFVLSGEAANQFANNTTLFVDSEKPIEYLRALGINNALSEETFRLECVQTLMNHLKMALNLQQTSPNSVVASETDEEGTFKVKGLHPDSYTVLVFGRGGANAALWMEQVTLETGKDDSLKMHSTKIGCFDPEGLAQF